MLDSRLKDATKVRRPARVKRPNKETLDAIREGEDALLHPDKYDWYSDPVEMMKELAT